MRRRAMQLPVDHNSGITVTEVSQACIEQGDNEKKRILSQHHSDGLQTKCLEFGVWCPVLYWRAVTVPGKKTIQPMLMVLFRTGILNLFFCCAKLRHSVFALKKLQRFQIIKIPLASWELFYYIWHWFQWEWCWGERWKQGVKTKGHTKSWILHDLLSDQRGFYFFCLLLMLTNICKEYCLIQWSWVEVQSKYYFLVWKIYFNLCDFICCF